MWWVYLVAMVIKKRNVQYSIKRPNAAFSNNFSRALKLIQVQLSQSFQFDKCMSKLRNNYCILQIYGIQFGKYFHQYFTKCSGSSLSHTFLIAKNSLTISLVIVFEVLMTGVSQPCRNLLLKYNLCMKEQRKTISLK